MYGKDGYSDHDDDSYHGFGPVEREKRPIPYHYRNYDFYSDDSDVDDGYTDSYHFSNSTSDRGEISDPDTDSAAPSSFKFPYRPHPLDHEHNKKGLPTKHKDHYHIDVAHPYEYRALRDDLKDFLDDIPEHGMISNDNGGYPVYEGPKLEKFSHLLFSYDFPEDCYECDYLDRKPKHPLSHLKEEHEHPLNVDKRTSAQKA